MTRTVVYLFGASRGFGQASALACTEILSGQPVTLVLVGKNIEGMKIVGEKCKRINANIEVNVHSLDFTQVMADTFSQQVKNIFKETSMKNVDEVFYIQNSGMVTPIALAEEIPSEEMMRAINVNISSFLVINAIFLQYMKKYVRTASTNKSDECMVKRIRMIQVSSILSKRCQYRFSVYGLCKAARDYAFETLALEISANPLYENVDFRILSWSPGPMKTDMMNILLHSTPPVFADEPDSFFVDTNTSALRMLRTMMRYEFVNGRFVDVDEVDDNGQYRNSGCKDLK